MKSYRVRGFADTRTLGQIIFNSYEMGTWHERLTCGGMETFVLKPTCGCYNPVVGLVHAKIGTSLMIIPDPKLTITIQKKTSPNAFTLGMSGRHVSSDMVNHNLYIVLQGIGLFHICFKIGL